jgi:hypothetical protein
MFLVNNYVKYKKARVFDPIHCKVTTQRNGHLIVCYPLFCSANYHPMRPILFCLYLDRILFNVNLLYLTLRFTDEARGDSNTYVPIIIIVHHALAMVPVFLWRWNLYFDFHYYTWALSSVIFTAMLLLLSAVSSSQAYSVALGFCISGFFRAEFACTLYSLYRTNGLANSVVAKQAVTATEFIAIVAEVISFMLIPHLWTFNLDYAKRYICVFNAAVAGLAGLVAIRMYYCRAGRADLALDGDSRLEDNRKVGYVDPSLIADSIPQQKKDGQAPLLYLSEDSDAHEPPSTIHARPAPKFTVDDIDLTGYESDRNDLAKAGLERKHEQQSDEEEPETSLTEPVSLQVCVPAPQPSETVSTLSTVTTSLSALVAPGDRNNGDETRGLREQTVDRRIHASTEEAKTREARALNLIYTLMSVVLFGSFAMYSLYTYAVGYVLYLVKQTGLLSIGAIFFFVSIILIILISAKIRRIEMLAGQLKFVSAVQFGCALCSWITFSVKTSEPSFFHIVIHWIATLSICYVIASPLSMIVDIQFANDHQTTCFADLVMLFRLFGRPMGIILSWCLFFYFLLPPYLVLGICSGYLATQVQLAYSNYYLVSKLPDSSNDQVEHEVIYPSNQQPRRRKARLNGDE